VKSRATSCGYRKTLEDANIKLDSVITDVMGLSGRKMIEAMIAGQKDPAKLARLADHRVEASQEQLREALHGRVRKHHRFLLSLHLQQIDALDASIAKIGREVEPLLRPFAPPTGRAREPFHAICRYSLGDLSKVGDGPGRGALAD
jgi:transposase